MIYFVFRQSDVSRRYWGGYPEEDLFEWRVYLNEIVNQHRAKIQTKEYKDIYHLKEERFILVWEYWLTDFFLSEFLQIFLFEGLHGNRSTCFFKCNFV